MNIIKSNSCLKYAFNLKSNLELARSFSNLSNLLTISSSYKTKSKKLFEIEHEISYNFRQKCKYSQKVYKKATQEVSVPTKWGYVKVQIFGNQLPNMKPIVALHGYLDNSNSFMPLSHFLTKQGFYVISLDLPGHGFSSHIPAGIQYSSRIVLTAVRRVIKHFHLKHYTMIGHSYGAMNSFMYSACYPKEVESLILLDPIVNAEREKRLTEMPKLWHTSIDEFIEFEDTKHLKTVEEDSVEKGLRMLTREVALEKLLKANKHLDETSANILLNRALVVYQNKLQFSRDKRLKVTVKGDHFIDWIVMSRCFNDYITCPLLFMYAWPPAYGEPNYRSTLEFFKTMRTTKKSGTVDIVKVEGSHHFHMIQPEQTSSIIYDFYKNKVLNKNVNST